MRTLLAGIGTGATLAGLAAALELIIRRRDLARDILVIVGSAELLGILAGIGGGIVALLLTRKVRAGDDGAGGDSARTRAARLTALLGLAAAIAIAKAAASGGRALTGPNVILTLVLAGVAIAIDVLTARRTIGGSRALPGPLRILTAPLVALPVLVAFPRLFLGEAPGDVNPAWGGTAVLLGLVLASLVLVSVVPWSPVVMEARRRLVAGVLGFGAVAALGAYGPLFFDARDESLVRRPNFLILVVDTLRPDHLSAYGYDRPTSPAIDALASEGVLFTNAVSPAAFTMPAMASLFTSRLPFEHGVRCHPSTLSADEVTLAERLEREGYATGAVVSNPLLSREWGFNQGFRGFDVTGETFLGDAANLFMLRAYALRSRGDTSGPTAARALRWLRRHDQRPFFLWVHLFDPHFPYQPPPPFDARFAGGPTPSYDQLLGLYQENRVSRGGLAVDTLLSAETLQEGAFRYDGEIAYADAGIGRLLDEVKRAGLAGRTICIVTADHGEALGEHGVNFAHTFTTYDEVIRVPLVIAGPGIAAAGGRREEQVDLLDIAPTVLELAGLPAVSGMRGQSLVPLLDGTALGGTAFGPRPAYAENAPLLPGHPSHALIASFRGMHVEGMAGKWRSVRLPPWKLIHVPGRPEGEELLFDLDHDPGETHDLSGDVSFRPDAEKARIALRASLRDFASEEAANPDDQVPSVSAEMEKRLRSLGYAH